jgi:hypothetical protein
MTIRLGEIDWGTQNNKFIRNLEIVSNYTSTDQNVTVQWSDTDTETFSTARNLNLSKRRKLSALGMTNQRTWQFGFSGADPIFLEAIEFDVDGGTV